jgi:hypothetical protein
MTKVNTKELMAFIGRHARILVAGLRRMVCGGLTVLLFITAIYGFINIPHGNGLSTIFAFVASFATLNLAIASMYVLGEPRRVRKERKGGNK